MDYGTRRCGKCSQIKLIQDLVPCGENCLFGTDGVSTICYDCALESINTKDLTMVDKLCQFLDIAFMAEEWIKISKTSDNERYILETYIKTVKSSEYSKSSWKQYDLLWEKARETDSVLSKLPTLSADLFIYLRKKWGSYDDFGVEDYLKMESYEKNTLNYYNFRDEARRDMIRKLALVSVLIDKKLASGDTREVSTLISSYQSLMKESGIQNAVQNDTETIESLSELIAFLEEHGWLMDYKVTESRDIVDATIRNFQQYVAAIVAGSGEEITQMYNTKLMEQNSGTNVNEEDIESMFETQEAQEERFEDETLNEEELIDMFKEISKEYEK
jgi:hypothetical protein|nr:MAG TPA: hypothetical protein [Caudoviricetes sp.]